MHLFITLLCTTCHEVVFLNAEESSVSDDTIWNITRDKTFQVKVSIVMSFKNNATDM